MSTRDHAKSHPPRGQAWFWTKEWQEREREADEAIARGDVSGPFTSAGELIRYLHSVEPA